MGEEQLYEDMLFLSVFLGAVWMAGYLCKKVNISQMVGQIVVGMILGPQGLRFVPMFTSEDIVEELFTDAQCLQYHNASDAQTHYNHEVHEEIEEQMNVDNYLVYLGQLGVTLLILESGLHVDFKTLKAVGVSAFIVAVIGTVVPITLGIGLAALLGFDVYPEGLGLGAIMGPTSVGISLQLLVEARVLDSTFGQTIVTAAFTDDIFSLITLAVLLELAAGELSAGSIIIPFVSSGAFLGIAFAIAIYIIPLFIPDMLEALAKKYGQHFRDIVHLGLMFIVLAVYGFVGDMIGSHLLGAFLAGVTFSKVPRTHQIWQKEMETIITWLTALFFAATVAFAVPIKELILWEAFWKGMLFTLVPGLIGKLVCGLFLKERWVIGWAMVGRGEFGFLVAQTLQGLEFQDTGRPFLSEIGTGVAMWALIAATLVAPIAFSFVLASQLKRNQEDGGGYRHNTRIGRQISNMTRKASMLFHHEDLPRSKWMITIGTSYQQRLAGDIMQILGRNDIHVESFINEGDMISSVLTFNVAIADPTEENFPGGAGKAGQRTREMYFKDDFFAFDIEKYIERLKTQIQDAVSNREATIKIERADRFVGTDLTAGFRIEANTDDDDKDSTQIGSPRNFEDSI